MRCPLKEDNFGRMPECQPDCAWLMMMNDTEQYRMCAVALIARKQADNYWMPVNYKNEVDDE